MDTVCVYVVSCVSVGVGALGNMSQSI